MMKPSVKRLREQANFDYGNRAGTKRDLEFEERSMELKKVPRKLGPLYTNEGWRKPSAKEMRQFYEQLDTDMKLHKGKREKAPVEFRKGGMVGGCREYGKKK